MNPLPYHSSFDSLVIPRRLFDELEISLKHNVNGSALAHVNLNRSGRAGSGSMSGSGSGSSNRNSLTTGSGSVKNGSSSRGSILPTIMSQVPIGAKVKAGKGFKIYKPWK